MATEGISKFAQNTMNLQPTIFTVNPLLRVRLEWKKKEFNPENRPLNVQQWISEKKKKCGYWSESFSRE